jgi:hypothetical protein
MIRIVRGAPATLSATFYADDLPSDVDGAVTVTIARSNGSVPVAVTATSVGQGVYTYALPPQAELAALTLTWSGTRGGFAVSTTTYAEVVGGTFFELDELRDSDRVLNNPGKYPDAKLRAARLFVENEFEGICGRGFVPHYAREVLYGDGNQSLWLTFPQLLSIISITVNGEDWSSKDVSAPEYNLRMLDINDGWWPYASKIVLEYRHGMLEPPIRIKTVAMKRAKYLLVADSSRIDERATTMSIPDFGNFVLATPGMRGSRTGIPDVDVVLEDYVLGGG